MKYASRILALMLTGLPALAIAQLHSNQKLVTQVPFEFVIGHKVVPAGDCIVQSATEDGKLLSIWNARAKLHMFSATLPGEGTKVAEGSMLVFHKYGNQYFLRGIEVKGSRTLYRLPVSPAEAELIARNVPAADEVLLASAK